jgi:hypothetical protein
MHHMLNLSCSKNAVRGFWYCAYIDTLVSASAVQVCAVTQGGAFAEEVVVPAAAAWHIPGKACRMYRHIHQPMRPFTSVCSEAGSLM